MQSEEQSQKKFGVWSWIAGGAIGAIVVGAVWGGVAYAHAGGPLVAKVGSTKISESALNNRLQGSYGNQMVQEMISEQLIKDAAAKYHITASKSDINHALGTFEAQYQISSPTQLSMFLAQNGLTQSQFNNILKDQVLEQKLAQRNVKVTNSQIQAYYNQHKSSFVPAGKKQPQPLSAVRTQVINDIKQQQAMSATQLFASISKWDPITIYDSKYSSVKSSFEASNSTGSPAGSPTGNSTVGNLTGNATSPANTPKSGNAAG